MFEKRYPDGEWFQITETELRSDIEGYVKDPAVSIGVLQAMPGDAIRLTPWATYRWVPA